MKFELELNALHGGIQYEPNSEEYMYVWFIGRLPTSYFWKQKCSKPIVIFAKSKIIDSYIKHVKSIVLNSTVNGIKLVHILSVSLPTASDSTECGAYFMW